MRIKYALIAAAAFFMLSPAFAKEQPDPGLKTISLSPTIEGAGLLGSPSDGSLGFDLWKNSTRKDIVRLLQSMPATSHDPHIQKLVYGLLLSKTDPAMMKSGEAIEEDKDLLSLRLNKLIEGGSYKQALDLYSSLGLENPPQSIAQAGITAMLYRGEKSLACLELNTVKDAYSAIPFFKTVAAYCDAVMSPQPSPEDIAVLNAAPEKLLPVLVTHKNYAFSYTPTEFERFSTLEKAILVAESKIHLPANISHDFKNIPASHLQILMINPALSPTDRFMLNVRALEWGLITPLEYKKELIAVIDLDSRKDPALALPPSAPAWEKLAYQLQISINKKSDSEKWPFIRQAMVGAKPYGLAALTPFGDILYKMAPEKLSFAEVQQAVRIMNRAGYALPPQWVDYIAAFKPSPTEKQAYTALFSAITGGDIPQENNGIAPAGGDEIAGPFVDKSKNIIENVDSKIEFGHTPDKVYDKNPDLTSQGDYVMPTIGIQNRLLEASKQGYIGETVLLVTVVLRGRNPWEIEPGLLRNVTQSLSSVGLTEISGTLATAAALGSSNDL